MESVKKYSHSQEKMLADPTVSVRDLIRIKFADKKIIINKKNWRNKDSAAYITRYYVYDKITKELLGIFEDR